MVVAAGPPITVIVVVSAVLLASVSAGLVALWRCRARGRGQRAARVLGLVCLLLMGVFLLYVTCTGAVYAYMIHVYEKVQTAQTRAEVQRMTWFLQESEGSDSYWLHPKAETQWIAKYRLLGLDGWDIHVEYDAQDRVLRVVDTYE